MHAASRKKPVVRPFAHRDIYIGLYFFGGPALNDAVTHNYRHRLTAIQAWRIDPNLFIGEYPADRQGFKPSLGKPLLLSLNGNAVLRGQIVKGGK